MAIAYGFAQAGLFNQRQGGMAAYAEDAYGKPGYFLVFLLYFLSLAIGNVAIGISAVGYLAGFFPWLSSTPIATCIGVIALAVAHDGRELRRPQHHRKDRLDHGLGRASFRSAGLSIIGWFWFSAETFAQAWNPHGLTSAQGMGSSIALTLWAFLGMESAAQNSDAVENPKRDVPLGLHVRHARRRGHLHPVDHRDPGHRAERRAGQIDRPVRRSPTRRCSTRRSGSIIMALAILACLGSLLGWQFTIAQTGKVGGRRAHVPGLLHEGERMGAPVTGMIVLGVVQIAAGADRRSRRRSSEQFSALVNLAVVTNVIPYIIALSALMVMMKTAGVAEQKYRLNMAVALVAMLYSIYALYASGNDAVMGGMLVIAITFIVWGFLAPRFSPSAAREAPSGSDEQGGAVRAREWAQAAE